MSSNYPHNNTVSYFSDADQQQFMSLRGLVKHNGGKWKSEKQAKFMLSKGRRDYDFLKSNFGLDATADQSVHLISAFFKAPGKKIALPYHVAFIVDLTGIVKQWKINTKEVNPGQWVPNPADLKLQYERLTPADVGVEPGHAQEAPSPNPVYVNPANSDPMKKLQPWGNKHVTVGGPTPSLPAAEVLTKLQAAHKANAANQVYEATLTPGAMIHIRECLNYWLGTNTPLAETDKYGERAQLLKDLGKLTLRERTP